MSGPWRDQVKLGKQNTRSDPNFRLSYPELSGMGHIRRGKIITLGEKNRKTFNFLVNPSTIETSYGMSNFDVTNRDGLDQVGLEHLTDGLLTLSFSLMLDRTYEVYKNNRQYTGGVLHDVLALEQVCGIPQDEVKISGPSMDDTTNARLRDLASSHRASVEAGLKNTLKGVIVRKYLRFLFGSKNAFSFDGYVSDLQVGYSHFSHTMVPTRAAVSISAVSFGESSPGGGEPIAAGATRRTGMEQRLSGPQ